MSVGKINGRFGRDERPSKQRDHLIWKDRESVGRIARRLNEWRVGSKDSASVERIGRYMGYSKLKTRTAQRKVLCSWA